MGLYKVFTKLVQRKQPDERLFDDVIGFDDVKEIFQMSVGAYKPVHILLVGPPASAKSLFMSSLYIITESTATKISFCYIKSRYIQRNRNYTNRNLV